MTINNSQLGYNTGASEYNIYKTNATVDALLKSNNNIAIRNSIIISSPIDSNSYYDIKTPAILMTDNNGYFLPLTYSMNTDQFNYSPNNNSIQLNSSYINSVIFSENSGIQNFPVGCKTHMFCYYNSLSKDIVPSSIAQQIIYNNDGKFKKRIHLGETIGINEKYYNKHTYFFNIVIDPINIKKENIDFSNSINCNIITNELFDENHISLHKYPYYDYNNSKNNTIYFLTLIPKENIDSTNESPKSLEFALYDDETNFERIFKYNFNIVEQNNNNSIFISNHNGGEVDSTATPTPTSTNTPSINPSVTPETTKY